MDLAALTDQVIKTAIEVGEYIRQERIAFDYNKVILKGKNDLVSHVDKESERRIISGLNKILPEASTLAEEGNNVEKGSPYTWIIDPLDGTTNFVHGIPAYAVSIALVEKDQPIIGVVYEVSRDECFSAYKNGGAKLNGKLISISAHYKLEHCLMATGFPVTVFDKIPQLLKILEDFVSSSHGVRRIGSAAMDLSYVACGRFDGFFEYNLNPWDVAAGILIVKEAGGIVSDFKGGDNYLYGREILAGNRAHKEMLEIIKRNWN